MSSCGSGLWNVQVDPQRSHNPAIAESIEASAAETLFEAGERRSRIVSRRVDADDVDRLRRLDVPGEATALHLIDVVADRIEIAGGNAALDLHLVGHAADVGHRDARHGQSQQRGDAIADDGDVAVDVEIAGSRRILQHAAVERGRLGAGGCGVHGLAAGACIEKRGDPALMQHFEDPVQRRNHHVDHLGRVAFVDFADAAAEQTQFGAERNLDHVLEVHQISG